MSNIKAMLAMLIGGMSPAAASIATAEFKADPETEASFKRTLDSLVEMDPAKVEAFFITVLVKDEDACEGCGEVHEEGLKQMASVSGKDTLIKAAVLTGCEQAGIHR